MAMGSSVSRIVPIMNVRKKERKIDIDKEEHEGRDTERTNRSQ